MENKKSFIGVFIALFAKVGPALLSLLGKLAKLSNVLKVGLAVATFATYAWMFSWQFALILMVMIGFHECGHLWAMKRMGLKTKGFYFIPFFGGAAISEEAFPSRWGEFYIAIMGPVWGLGLSLVAAIIWLYTNSPQWAAIAAFWALINFFNLAPVNPLDGGRILKSIAFSFNSTIGLVLMFVGLVLGIFVAAHMGLGLVVFLVVIGGIELFFETMRYLSIRKANVIRKQAINLIDQSGCSPSGRQELMAMLPPEEFNLPTMDLKTNLFAIGSFLFVAFMLYEIIAICSRSVGANLAMEFLKS